MGGGGVMLGCESNSGMCESVRTLQVIKSLHKQATPKTPSKKMIFLCPNGCQVANPHPKSVGSRDPDLAKLEKDGSGMPFVFRSH